MRSQLSHFAAIATGDEAEQAASFLPVWDGLKYCRHSDAAMISATDCGSSVIPTSHACSACTI
ncbi:bsr1878 [Bradyrhizobium diazoefficiens USDA 110]|uniref:Bsr1878 protein n=2 Tax=Bradyrhizobium TaxID=374 RepID=Q89TM6_BRADU|nr:hypothetical protein CIT37_04150 [Bradyrhizobium ottawaense]MYV88377.1 hypothetical protein [Bradyrhizobium japonicum]PDT55896.1 hypothetical protein CO678_41360 [Bradyrhizobium diazoefficiens]QBP20742.1 hypothetical protein Bdiaspc4_09530 [Bradyrhizobium diazoefficiens]BAC47143.1 bsr1878 [Bradyrhizobium diazoefficiens USDA 110]